MIYTEHLVNASRRPQTSKRTRKPPKHQVGQKENRNGDRTCAPERKLWRRKGFYTLGSPFMSREIDLGGGMSRASEPGREAWQWVCRS